MIRWRFVGELIALVFSTIAFCATLVGLAASILSPSSAGSCDFVEYWAAGKVLLSHGNPYDASLILPIERSAGYPKDLPALLIPNPPSATPLMVPLGLFHAQPARLLWTGALLLCLLSSIALLSRLYGPLKTPSWVLAATFAPAMACLLAGQITLFLLAGAVLFLRLHSSRPFLAGAALWFCLLKPHVFVPAACVLLLWIALTSSYRILAGVFAALGLTSLLAVGLNAHIFTQYRQSMLDTRIDRLPVPCLSILLRGLVWPHNLIIQCAPLALGCVWAILYFYRHRATWSWTERLPLLLVVSVLVAPYSFLVDQVLIIPAMVYALQALPDFDRTSSRSLVAILAVSSGVVEIATLSGHPLLHSFFFVWTVPFWLVWYLAATWTVGREKAMRPLAI